MPDLTFTLSTRDDAYVIKNLYPLYTHDLSAYCRQTPNAHGIIEGNPLLHNLAEQADLQDLWWQKPGVLFPYLIRVDGRPAGFVMVATPPHVAHGVDFMMHEFFVVHAYRGTGVAQWAAVEAMARHHGKWHAYCLPGNDRAIRFWRHIISAYTSGRFEERVGRTILGEHNLHVFSFANATGAASS